MSFKKITFNTRGLKPGDGMSAVNSNEADRGHVLSFLQHNEGVSDDSVKYGFYISEVWPGVIPDYDGKSVKREIVLKNIM